MDFVKRKTAWMALALGLMLLLSGCNIVEKNADRDAAQVVATVGGEDILKAACSKDTKWLPGKRLSSRESAASVQKWVESLGL